MAKGWDEICALVQEHWKDILGCVVTGLVAWMCYEVYGHNREIGELQTARSSVEKDGLRLETLIKESQNAIDKSIETSADATKKDAKAVLDGALAPLRDQLTEVRTHVDVFTERTKKLDELDKAFAVMQEQNRHTSRQLDAIENSLTALQVSLTKRPVKTWLITTKATELPGNSGWMALVHLVDSTTHRMETFGATISEPKEPQFMAKVMGVAMSVDATAVRFTALPDPFEAVPGSNYVWRDCSFALDADVNSLRTLLTEMLSVAPVERPRVSQDVSSYDLLSSSLIADKEQYTLLPASAPPPED